MSCSNRKRFCAKKASPDEVKQAVPLCPIGGSTPQLASTFGWLLFTSWRCCTTPHSRPNRRTIWCLRRRNVMKKSGHNTKQVRPEPASPKPSAYQNSASTRSSEDAKVKQNTLLLQGEAGRCTARFILDVSSPLAAFRQSHSHF